MSDAIRAEIGVARAGDAKAQYNLGMRYLAGRGVKKDSAEAAKWFEIGDESPYMLVVSPVRPEHRLHPVTDNTGVSLARLQAPRSTVPAVTHIDYSARLQTVDAERQPRLSSK